MASPEILMSQIWRFCSVLLNLSHLRKPSQTIEIRKGLTKENLRDNMTNMELLLNALAEETATEISKQRNPEGLSENANVAKEGAEVAKTTRKEVEKRLGHSVVSPEKAIKSPEEPPFAKAEEQ